MLKREKEEAIGSVRMVWMVDLGLNSKENL